ncbi:LacI family DNA-binding transcriptional regulator [Spiroplasma turonicum]|uniref:Trehalose operon repressor, repressor of treA,B,C n=1 Tax=Spiroplasma turonicum TaxID=216946 RepID=A0A0K1P6Q2_9MOLU|nr:LacI family DNA-binding transcriptional regulator [Spiroplasma turonicum]AKU79894.1 trehalose operon repressor, repressor of treA,B,C [Spiroplasma turonicum]ALX70905.1 trehalose operon repressor [Spiroplasma turonicum]
MKKEKFTYHTIAKKAGVGVGTVSRYFNNYNISEESRKKIKNILDEVEYVPNYAASSIKKPNKDVYLILPFNSEEKANMEIVNGVKKSLSEENYNFFVFISSGDSNNYQKDLKTLEYRNSYGLILLLPKQTTTELYDQIKKIRTTKVIVYNRQIDNVLSEGIEDNQIFTELAFKIDHTYNNKKIVFIGITDDDLTTGKIRKSNFINNIVNNKVVSYQLKSNSYDDVMKVIKSIINIDKPDIIVSATHTIALSVHNYLTEKNLRNKFILTDITRLNKTQFIKNFDINIVIDYYSLGYRLGNKLLNKSIKMEKLFKIL